MIGHIFDGSRRLREIVESYEWMLLDITNYCNNEVPYTWEELEDREPAVVFERDCSYLFVPKLAKGQTLRQAYSVAKGLGPSIWIPSPKEHEDMDGFWPIIIDDNLVYLFTRLIFTNRRLIATSPTLPQMPYPPILEILYRSVNEKFGNYFRITTKGDIDRKSPIDNLSCHWNPSSKLN